MTTTLDENPEFIIPDVIKIVGARTLLRQRVFRNLQLMAQLRRPLFVDVSRSAETMAEFQGMLLGLEQGVKRTEPQEVTFLI
jgi:hypothetical protein